MERDWLLIAPWYRWPKKAVRGNQPTQRLSAPVLQKFDRPNCIDDFLDDPQRSLRFDESDRFRSAGGGGFLQIFVRRLGFVGGSLKTLAAPEVAIDLRKIFLDTHKRYYLVVCELHCDGPGLPTESFDHACQAGFVVRRYRSYAPAGQVERAQQTEIFYARDRELQELEGRARLHGRALRARDKRVEALRRSGQLESTLSRLRQERAAAQDALRSALSPSGSSAVLEGWIPGDHDGLGSWSPVQATGQRLEESSYPLYPLKPDPAQPEHDGQGVSIYFGLLPTNALETEARGEARYSSEVSYHLRCFVRRHDPLCQRSRERAPDCQGRIFWSDESEPYRLANFHDLDGTSNRPINIPIPDLGELKEKVLSATRPGEFSPVRLLGKNPMSGTFQICFLSIPLVTLVALFVFNIFLPIVFFIFGAWFLLLLNLCIPPKLSIDLSASLRAELDVALSVDLELAVISSGLRSALMAKYATLFSMGSQAMGDPPDTGAPSDADLLRMAKQALQAQDLDPLNPGPGIGPAFFDNLRYEERVFRWEVF